ncbi:Tannase/feruloyl esterase [Stachybotrys elegans]|uniref:Carboxylic ester hydrolase n=1 Tax=Stachybotrys elegans TaxID=80388 RepID=A0A8K0SH10_9HYPO|nr:Tannase/feruloyl esterase [Stachybotrys elegans]
MELFAGLGKACSSSAFASLPPVFGTEVVSVQADIVTNFTEYSFLRLTHPPILATDLSFCNVTVTYTHPGLNDAINVETWLPLGDWNERLYAAGGGGFGAGRFFLPYNSLVGALAEGYATVTSDAGLGFAADAINPSAWALKSHGNVDLHLLQNFGSSSLGEMATFAKSILEEFYGSKPQFSYFNGCSQGGRQGMALAQRYPEAFDGILAGAPGFHFPRVAAAIEWSQQFMNELNEYPRECEMDAITEAAVETCDGLDGAVDGIISFPTECMQSFNPMDLVGNTIDCWSTGSSMEISRAAGLVVQATWNGIADADGRSVWDGYHPGTNITGKLGFVQAPAVTTCREDGSCTGNLALSIGKSWLRLFAAKDPDFDVSHLTREEFLRLVRQSDREFASFLATDDADLSPFQKSGGKLLSWHGLMDDAVPPRPIEKYYEQVSQTVPETQSFYKHFSIPGLGHCGGGLGGQPIALFEQLRAWVEEGVEPHNTPVSYNSPNGEAWERIACPYPQKAMPSDGCEDYHTVDCWECK